MAENNMALIQRLSEENPRFRKLHEEHILFEKKLQELDERTYLTPEEDLERIIPKTGAVLVRPLFFLYHP